VFQWQYYRKQGRGQEEERGTCMLQLESGFERHDDSIYRGWGFIGNRFVSGQHWHKMPASPNISKHGVQHWLTNRQAWKFNMLYAVSRMI